MRTAQPLKKKRGKPREPLTDEELDAGRSYYSQTDIERILKVFPVTTIKTVDPGDFAKRVDRAAWWYVEVSAMSPVDPASIAQRRFERLASKLQDGQEAIDELPALYRIELIHAADRLARRSGHLPDLEPDWHDFPPPDGTEHGEPIAVPAWPVEDQLEKALNNLTWLRQIADEAAIRAERNIGQTGSRPDEPEHEFVCTLASIFKGVVGTVEIKRPRIDRITDRWRNNRILRFVIACQRPLGTAGTLMATLRLLERAGVFDHRSARRNKRASHS